MDLTKSVELQIGGSQSPDAGTSPSRRHASPTSPSRAGRQGTRESVSSSKLFRDISPTKVFTQMPVDISRVSLPDLFKQKEALVSLRPHYSLNFLQKQEETASPPKLLQRLEGLLEEKLNMVNKVGGAGRGFAAAQMRTDAYRQVFDAFLHSFTTYRSLLMRVKQEYDTCLDDAMASVFDNVHMQADLALSGPKMDAALEQARHKALEDAAASRKEIQDEQQQQEATAQEAELRCQHADQEMSSIKAHTAKLQQEIQQLNQEIAEARYSLLAATSFAQEAPALLTRLEAQHKSTTKKASE